MLSRPTSRRFSDGAAGGHPLITSTSSQIIGLSAVEANCMGAHGRGGVITRLMSHDPSLGSAGIVAIQNLGLEANLICELTIPDVPSRS